MSPMQMPPHRMMNKAESNEILAALNCAEEPTKKVCSQPERPTSMIPRPKTTVLPKGIIMAREHVKDPTAPYFYYRDFSDLSDPDPSKPVTAPGRIPNFPAKMMAILSRPDLSDIISWMPHGRSWKVHKPREFEVKVIPAYFEHSKFSSFIRQANGWGFRRMISKGPDRNSYYHELFLRGQPHLVKLMKRPTSNTRPQADANTEPDFYRIADDHPLPEPKIAQDCTYEKDGGALQRHSYVEKHQHHYTGELVAPIGEHHHNAHTPIMPLPEPSSIQQLRSYEPVSIEPYQVYMPQSRHPPQTVAYHQAPARSISPVHYHAPLPSYQQSCAPAPVTSYHIPANQWTETCAEPYVMPFDFEDPFAGGLMPVDFW